MSTMENLIMKMQMISLMMENGLAETKKPILTLEESIPNITINNFLPNQSINLTIADSGLALPAFNEKQNCINIRGVISNNNTVNVHSIACQEYFDYCEELINIMLVAKALTLVKSINIINFLKMPPDTAKKYIGIEDDQMFIYFTRLLVASSKIFPAAHFDSIIKIGNCSLDEIITLYKLSIRGNDSCPVFVCNNSDLNQYTSSTYISEEGAKELKRILRTPNVCLYQMGKTQMLKLGNRDCRLF